MACFKPLYGYQNDLPNSNGKFPVYFSRNGSEKNPITVPCGRCIGCRLERARQWGVRCMHEASLHEENAFITLTYNDENLPKDGSLNKKHFQDFMKRLRYYMPGKTIKFYHCGEYGPKLQRPHYHACLFGVDFEDKELWKITPNKERLFTSALLSKAWQNRGFVTTGSVTFESANYVARYILKKITGDKANEHYESIDYESGLVSKLQPEYTTMSRGGRDGRGIAHDWYERFSSDVFPSDSVIVNGSPCMPPRYYVSQLEQADPDLYKTVKEKRKARALNHLADQTEARLKVRENVKLAQIGQLIRPYEAEQL